MKRSRLFILLILIAIVAGLLLLFFYKQTKNINTDRGIVYIDPIHKFELTYPANWKSPATSSHTNPDYDKYLIFSAQDPDRQPAEPGGAFAPVFSIKSFSSPSELPPLSKYFQAEPEEINSSTTPVQLSTGLVTQEKITSFAVEGSNNITYRLQLTNNKLTYLLEMGYTLAGCTIRPAESDQQCKSINQQYTNKANFAWNLIIASFRFH